MIDPRDDMSIFALDDSPLRRRFLLISLLCGWLLMFVTFSAPGRDQQTLGSLDLIAMAKVSARAISLGLLTCLLLPLWNVPKRKAVLGIMLPLALFVALAVVSTLWSPLATFTLGQAGSLTVLFLLAMTIAILWSSARDTSTILCSLSSALLAVSAVLVLARLFAPDLHSMSREGAGMFHATCAGSTASLGMVVLVTCRLLWSWRWTRILFPGVLIHAVVLLVAINRVSLLLTFVLVAFVVLRYSNRAVAWGTILGVCVAATCYVAFDPGFRYVDALLGTASSYANRGQTFSDLQTLSGRTEMWLAVWNAYQQSIWLGHGYSVCSPTGELFVWYQWSNWTAHNVVLQCLMSTGIVGFVLLFWALARIASRSAVSYWRGRGSRELTIFLIVVACWYSLWGLFNATFLGPVTPESVAFFVVIGLAVGAAAASNCGTSPTINNEQPLTQLSGWA